MNAILQSVEAYLSSPEGFIVGTMFTSICVTAILTLFDRWGDSDWAEREWNKIQEESMKRKYGGANVKNNK